MATKTKQQEQTTAGEAPKGRAVVVTTKDRGVFFGYVKDASQAPKSITLARCRNCLYFAANTRGFLGLTVSGPTDGSRVGPAAPEVQLFDLTSVAACTPEAVTAWEQGPWAR